MKQAGSVAPVILVGQSDTRLRPLARNKLPKSFVRVLSGRSLFQNTVLRVSDFQSPILVCHESYQHLVQEQLDEINVKPRVIILESAHQGTAAALALVAFYLKNKGERMLVLPSDHVLEEEGFEACVYAALDKIDTHIVLFGVKPVRAESRCGYIFCEEEKNISRRVVRFVDNPSPKYAQKLFKEPNCFWNTGIFLVRPRIFLDELKSFEPETHKFSQRAFYAGHENDCIYTLAADDFAKILPMSVEHAILEMCQRVYMYEMPLFWSDVERWPQMFRETMKSIFRREKRIYHESKFQKRAS